MARRISKNRKAVLAKYSPEKAYTLEEAAKVVKEITFVKFDSSVDLDVRLGVDPKKSDQMVRGVVAMTPRDLSRPGDPDDDPRDTAVRSTAAHRRAAPRHGDLSGPAPSSRIP